MVSAARASRDPVDLYYADLARHHTLTREGEVGIGRRIEAAERACTLAPGSADAHDALAMALYSAGQHEAAAPQAREAVRLDPEAAEYQYDLGLVQEALGDIAAARDSFGKAVELAPDFDEAREALRRLEGGP